MNGILITMVSILYLGVLFYLAFVAEKFKGLNKSLINNPFVFALSLAVYCTAWTFYGSVGRVDQLGDRTHVRPVLAARLQWRRSRTSCSSSLELPSLTEPDRWPRRTVVGHALHRPLDHDTARRSRGRGHSRRPRDGWVRSTGAVRTGRRDRGRDRV